MGENTFSSQAADRCLGAGLITMAIHTNGKCVLTHLGHEFSLKAHSANEKAMNTGLTVVGYQLCLQLELTMAIGESAETTGAPLSLK